MSAETPKWTFVGPENPHKKPTKSTAKPPPPQREPRKKMPKEQKQAALAKIGREIAKEAPAYNGKNDLDEYLRSFKGDAKPADFNRLRYQMRYIERRYPKALQDKAFVASIKAEIDAQYAKLKKHKGGYRSYQTYNPSNPSGMFWEVGMRILEATTGLGSGRPDLFPQSQKLVQQYEKYKK